MYLNKICKMQNVGIYRNFEWGDELPKFSTFNLIYGWNYSGKTTLSRVIDSLRDPSLIAGLKGQFEIELESGELWRSGNPHKTYNCKVFNRYFIERNFQQENSAPSVFIVGDEAVKIRNRICTLKARRDRLVRINKRLSDKKSEWKKVVNDGLKRGEARAISELVAERNFDRRGLDGLLEQVKADHGSFLLSDSDFELARTISNSTEKFSKLDRLNVPDIDVQPLVAEVEALLHQTASNNAIQRLRENSDLEAWVRRGRELHEEDGTCGFCGNQIDSFRMEVLKGHFSNEYESLVRRLQAKSDGLANLDFSIDLPENAELIHTVRERYADVITSLKNTDQIIKNLIVALIEALNSKISSIETHKSLDGAVYQSLEELSGKELSVLSDEVRCLFKLHNSQIEDVEKTKFDAKSKLKLHAAAAFYIDNAIEKKDEEYLALEASEGRLKRLGVVVDAQIKIKEDEIKEHSIAVAKLNELISVILTENPIVALQLNENEFEFRRGDEPAVHLSEGERTAIAFAYFLLTLEDGGNDLSSSLVFVDDPISSLDSNHIYSVYALIVERLKDKCSQLFVSTHNYEFLNFLKDEAISGGKFSNGCKGYLVQRNCDDNGDSYSALVEMPKPLRQFKSEYQLIFSVLHKFVSSPDVTMHEAYTSPILLRKFLESYLGFRRPKGGRWSDKLDLLFENASERKEVAKFANDASHLQSFKQVVEHGEFIASAKGVVKKVLDAIECRDSGHFEGLKDALDG